jgi:hypothetical protein
MDQENIREDNNFPMVKIDMQPLARIRLVSD